MQNGAHAERFGARKGAALTRLQQEVNRANTVVVYAARASKKSVTQGDRES